MREMFSQQGKTRRDALWPETKNDTWCIKEDTPGTHSVQSLPARALDSYPIACRVPLRPIDNGQLTLMPSEARGNRISRAPSILVLGNAARVDLVRSVGDPQSAHVGISL